jgi:hypothetical protein
MMRVSTSLAITAVAWIGFVSAQELAGRELQVSIPASVDGEDALTASILTAAGTTRISEDHNSVPTFNANFDLAARAYRPAPLAPGSAEVP